MLLPRVHNLAAVSPHRHGCCRDHIASRWGAGAGHSGHSDDRGRAIAARIIHLWCKYSLKKTIFLAFVV